MNAAALPVSLARATDNRTEPGTLGGIHGIIKGTALAAATAEVRAAPDDKARAAAKRRLPGFIAAGRFVTRKTAAWASVSGLMVADFDHVGDLDRLRASLAGDPCVALLFTSPSGAGIKAVIRVPVDSPDSAIHRQTFAAAARWAREAHGADLDPSGKDPARLCFLCHDPGALLNPGAAPLDLDRWAPPAAPAPAAPVAPTIRPDPASGPDVERRALAYAVAMPASVQGAGGSAALMAVLRCLRDGFDLSGAALWRCMDAWNAQRASPPWSHGQLAHALDSVEAQPPTRPRGWLLREPVPARTAPTSDGEPAPDGSEAALAAYLAGTDLRWRLRWSDVDGGRWLEWTGTHWAATADRAPLALQAAVRRALAAGLESHRIEARTAPRLESAAAIRGIACLLAAWPSMRMPGETDPPGLIACPRGVLDLGTGEWLAHDPARSVTRCCPVDPGPSCDLWAMVEAHLVICLGDLYPAVHRFLGSALLGMGADRRLLWLHGPGGDGKSTLAKILRAALGPWCAIIPAEAFAAGGARGAHGHELAAGMAGVRLAIGLEVDPRLDWGRVKSLTGGDEQRTKRLHGRAFCYDKPPVLVLVSNDRPTPPDRASAERLIVAELRPPEDQDERLMETLKAGGPERDAIAAACLGWLIRGCADFRAHGLGPVPMAAFEPAGLARWWRDAVDAGRIVLGKGWSSLHDLRRDLEAFAAGEAWEPPCDREIALFLKSVIPCKRTKSGRLYQAVVTHGDA